MCQANFVLDAIAVVSNIDIKFHEVDGTSSVSSKLDVMEIIPYGLVRRLRLNLLHSEFIIDGSVCPTRTNFEVQSCMPTIARGATNYVYFR